jgi:hypothetical protein
MVIAPDLVFNFFSHYGFGDAAPQVLCWRIDRTRRCQRHEVSMRCDAGCHLWLALVNVTSALARFEAGSPRTRSGLVSLRSAFLLACLVGQAAAQPDATQVSGDAVIRAPADGSEIVIATTSRLAGAIHSLTWNGREFIDSHDHGRQLQSASNLDLGGSFHNETFNPTEAGSMHDGAGPTSTSRLLWISAAGRELATVTQMAFWLRPGEASHGHPAVNTTPLSNHLLQKHVHIGAPGLPHAIRYAVTFTLPADERHGKATFEILTAYMPAEFRTFHGLRADDGLAPLAEAQGEQSLPVIASTADGSHAMGAWSPDRSRSSGQPATYGRFWFEQDRVAKWNCVVREKADAAGGAAASSEGDDAGRLPPGEYRYLVWVAVGTREQVRDTLAQLRDRHVKSSRTRSE